MKVTAHIMKATVLLEFDTDGEDVQGSRLIVEYDLTDGTVTPSADDMTGPPQYFTLADVAMMYSIGLKLRETITDGIVG